jgi:leader peptidase (prepilin peptidase)/N-methyltransferase
LNILSIEYAVVLFCLFVLGSVFGSLLNVCIYRLPREERFWQALRHMVYPPSHCPRCRQPIRWYDNIPIISWLMLRRRCRNCRGTISVRYPLVELLTGLLFALVYWSEIPDWWGPVVQQSSVYHELGPTGIVGSTGMSPLAMLHWRYALHLALVIALVVATFIDIDLRIIPDAVTLPAMAVALLASWLLGQVYIVPLWYQTPAMNTWAVQFGAMLRQLIPPAMIPAWFAPGAALGVPAWITANPHLHGLCLSLMGIVVGGGIIWAVRIVGHWALKREAMGFGDVVLMAMIGSFLGWQGTLIVFFLSLIAAVVVAIPVWLIWRDHELPYGPYLSMGALVLLLSARHIWPGFDTRIFAMGPMLLPVALFMALLLGAMLVVWRGIKRALGFARGDLADYEESWRPGDQLAYLAGECSDDGQGQWPKCEWPGRLSGRGQGHIHGWRCSDCCRRPGICYRTQRLP